jgi:hypothetical protein
MINVLSRPPIFCTVGGVFANPALYLVETDAAFAECVLFKETGQELARVKASRRNGVCKFDVSGFLRAQMALIIPDGTLTVSTLTGSCVGFYAVFTAGAETVSDILFTRYAVNAALPFGESDFQQYTV